MRLVLFGFAILAVAVSASVGHAASCTSADIAAYHRLEREFDVALKKCVAALDARSSRVCTLCKPLHNTMWKAEKWRDSHASCVEQTKANLKRVKRYHALTRDMDAAMKVDCNF